MSDDDHDLDDNDGPKSCEQCQDEYAWNPLSDGRQVCIGCVFDICNELLRERATPTPTTSAERSEALADEVASVLVQLDKVWADKETDDDRIIRRCRDRLRAAIKQAKGE
jgi:hypothetical protein